MSVSKLYFTSRMDVTSHRISAMHASVSMHLLLVHVARLFSRELKQLACFNLAPKQLRHVHSWSGINFGVWKKRKLKNSQQVTKNDNLSCGGPNNTQWVQLRYGRTSLLAKRDRSGGVAFESYLTIQLVYLEFLSVWHSDISSAQSFNWHLSGYNILKVTSPWWVVHG